MPARPSSIGLIHGHVEAGVAHDLHRASEPLAVAELGPDRGGQQAADPVMRVDERPTAGLAFPEALQLAPQR